MPANFKTFDFYDEATGRAISAKTLDTSTQPRVNNPENIYSTIKGYVDAAADFEGYGLSNKIINPDTISSREIYLAVPSSTNASQWYEINKSIEYANKNNVKLTVTVVK